MAEKLSIIQTIDWAYSRSQILNLFGKARRRPWDKSGTNRLAITLSNFGDCHNMILNDLPFLIWVDEWMETSTRYHDICKTDEQEQKEILEEILKSISSKMYSSDPSSSLGTLCKLIVWQEKQTSNSLPTSLQCSASKMLSLVITDLEKQRKLQKPLVKVCNSSKSVDFEGSGLEGVDLTCLTDINVPDDTYPYLFSENLFDPRYSQI